MNPEIKEKLERRNKWEEIEFLISFIIIINLYSPVIKTKTYFSTKIRKKPLNEI